MSRRLNFILRKSRIPELANIPPNERGKVWREAGRRGKNTVLRWLALFGCMAILWSGMLVPTLFPQLFHGWGMRIFCAVIGTIFYVIALNQLDYHTTMPQLRKELRRRGLCPFCGYDLRGSSERCPECGRMPSEVDEDTLPKPDSAHV